MVFPVPMEQAYNTLASYIRNAPLATSLTDPLAACTGLPDRSSNGAPERPLPPHGESAGDAKIDAKASKDESAASPTSGQSDSDGSFFGSTRSGSSSLSDAFRLFQEKMRISVQHHEASEAAGRGSAENADSLSSLNGREDPTVVTAQPDGPEGRVVGEQTSDGIAAPVRGGVCLSASGHVRRSSSVPPAAAKIEVPAEGDLSIGIHGCTSLPTAFPPRAGTDVSLRHPPMSRCFAMAAPASSDQLPSAAGSSVGDTSLRNSKTTGAVVGPLVDTQGRDGRLGLAAKAGLAQSQEMPTEITPISHFVSTRAPGSLLIRGGGLAGGRESSKPVAAAAVAAATAAQAAASATRSLCDWRSTQADVSSFVDIPHPLLSGSNSHQQQPNVRGLEIERRTDVRVGGMGDQSLKSGADYTSPLAAVPTVGKGDTSQKSVDRLQGEGKQESTTTESPIEDFDIERIPVSAESPPPPLNEWPQGSVLLRATEEEWIVNRVRALFAKEKKRAGLTNERSQRPRRPLPKICYPRPPLLFMSKELPDPQQAIHRFENPFFRGAVVVRLAPVGGTPGGEVYPDSKKRYMQACVQGQFLQPHKVGEVLTGGFKVDCTAFVVPPGRASSAAFVDRYFIVLFSLCRRSGSSASA
ncbi:hypothetical protein CSUI_003727 [Cystoisospora suis]|uniref:Domain of unknown function at the cortex 1 domain-containing protein n=1 Tax=Cystoisospora suis TaxID=483139 RepID=A0A2C6L4B9_9APIC|nr:hypothetical protein CSUI_003727 [Cystoisospora suis]